MTQPLHEAQRIAQLEEIRTPSTSHIIDDAIASGKTAHEVAHAVIKAEHDALAAVDSIANAMNSRRDPKGSAAASSTTGNTDADMIAAAMNKNRKGAQ